MDRETKGKEQTAEDWVNGELVAVRSPGIEYNIEINTGGK